jgi:hypothetical protein
MRLEVRDFAFYVDNRCKDFAPVSFSFLNRVHGVAESKHSSAFLQRRSSLLTLKKRRLRLRLVFA